MSEERLARFFIKQDGTYQIDKQVREAVTFAAHNVLMDPPFLNMDLISCRNLLIYIEPEMQKKILSLFAFGLKPGGYLFLGKSENPIGAERRVRAALQKLANFPAQAIRCRARR